ncbi:hypothetical protein B0H13DRAFT_2378379 [Mycena leptocephala]|nr:hypothetical protein B0H13DRAFT_2378379 [Mycena leptocephala]
MPAHKKKKTNVSGLRNQGSNRSSPAVSAPSTAPPSPSPEPAGPLFGATPDQSDSETATDDEEQCTMFDSLRNDWEAEERALTNSDIDSELGSDADWDMDEEEGLESMKALARQVDPTDDGEWLPPKQVRENLQKRAEILAVEEEIEAEVENMVVPDDDLEAWEEELDENIAGPKGTKQPWPELHKKIQMDIKKGRKTLPLSRLNALMVLLNFSTLVIKGYGLIEASRLVATSWHKKEGVWFTRRIRDWCNVNLDFFAAGAFRTFVEFVERFSR